MWKNNTKCIALLTGLCLSMGVIVPVYALDYAIGADLSFLKQAEG
jgi:hypothetical protein